MGQQVNISIFLVMLYLLWLFKCENSCAIGIKKDTERIHLQYEKKVL